MAAVNMKKNLFSQISGWFAVRRRRLANVGAYTVFQSYLWKIFFPDKKLGRTKIHTERKLFAAVRSLRWNTSLTYEFHISPCENFAISAVKQLKCKEKSALRCEGLFLRKLDAYQISWQNIKSLTIFEWFTNFWAGMTTPLPAWILHDP